MTRPTNSSYRNDAVSAAESGAADSPTRDGGFLHSGLGHALGLGLLFLLARLDVLRRLGSPVLGWRPADLAGVALGYLRHGFNFMYPEVLWGGNGPGYVEMEFPLVPFVTALLYKVFGVQQWVCLVVPTATGIALMFVTYRLAQYLFDDVAALIAAAVVAVSPTFVLLTSTGLWADPPMVLFGTIALYMFVCWADSGALWQLVAAVCCMCLAVLLKLTALYLGLPILFIFVSRYGRSVWRQPVFLAAGVCMLAPPTLWYLHAYHLYTLHHHTFGILMGGYRKFGTFGLLTDPRFYARVSLKTALYQLTPLAALSAGYALLRNQARSMPLLRIWAISLAAYVLVCAQGVDLGHYHYLLPVLPLGAVLAGAGALPLWRRSAATAASLVSRFQVFALVSTLLVVSVAGANYVFLHRDVALLYREWQQQKATGEHVGRVTVPDSLLLVVDEQMDAVQPERSMTPPDVFYFADRHGWYLSMAWLTGQRIEDLHSHGARYLVISGIASQAFRSTRSSLREDLSRKYRVVFDDDDGLVFDMSAPVAFNPPQPLSSAYTADR
jgi:4-amino-4-deoxy-L-arabinose transferase-like glycosyltransferase